MKLRRKSFVLLGFVMVAIFVTSCKTSSPANTLQNRITALKSKDFELFKASTSAYDLDLLEKNAKALGKTPEQEFEAEFLSKSPSFILNIPDPIETRGESIDGNKAIIYMNLGSKWEQAHLVKEDGDWKIYTGDSK